MRRQGEKSICCVERERTQNSNHEPKGNSKFMRKNMEYFYCHKMEHYKRVSSYEEEQM
jgi:hypothetical protein